MYQYILFDLDGTLTDSKEGIVKCLQYAIAKLGDPVPDEEALIKFIGPPLQESFMEYCGYSEEKARQAVLLFQERYFRIGRYENQAAPGLAALCRRLKDSGRVVALASSKPEKLCTQICEYYGFSESMTALVGSPMERDWSKGEVIREACRRLGLTEADRENILMVGDRKFDVLGAAECGIVCVGVEFFGYAAPGELADAGAVAVVRTVEELEAFILSH